MDCGCNFFYIVARHAGDTQRSDTARPSSMPITLAFVSHSSTGLRRTRLKHVKCPIFPGRKGYVARNSPEFTHGSLMRRTVMSTHNVKPSQTRVHASKLGNVKGASGIVAATLAAMALLMPFPGGRSHVRAAGRTCRTSPMAERMVSPSRFRKCKNETLVAVALKKTRQNSVLHSMRVVLPKKQDPPLHIALKCALIAGTVSTVVISATIAVFWVIQDSLVYKPTSVWRGSPKSWDMPYYDDVSYCTLDNVEITGWFIRQPPGVYRNARTLIYFHGTDKNASFRLKKVVGFYEKCKCNILLLSYRGYGVSTGKPNEKGLRIDAESALDYLISRRDVDVSPGGNLWVFGESLGGAVAIHFTKKYEDNVRALILENTFTSLLDMIKLEFPVLGVFRYLSRNRWQSKKRIRKIGIPILFLSGKQDSYIPPVMMRRMYELAENAEVREFVEFDEGTHNRTWTLHGFYESIDEFMTKVEMMSSSPEPEPATLSSGREDENEMVTAAA